MLYSNLSFFQHDKFENNSKQNKNKDDAQKVNSNENFAIFEKWTVKIGDFGLATVSNNTSCLQKTNNDLSKQPTGY